MSTNFKAFFALHMILLVYSVTAIFNKLAAAEPFFNTRFIIFYGMAIGLLGLYAIVWQQIIKVLPLTTAYSCKAVTVVWGIIWGGLFFHETVTAGKMIGAVLIVTGIVIFSGSERAHQYE